MCGIAGFVTLEPPGNARSIVERMMAVIHHRGPDGAGIHDAGVAWLGHRRLSIIDVAAGAQPMSNETGDVWITYNGEIFNHAAVRPELERLGHRYGTRCDTETIVHAWEQYGADCVSRFRGMFAFAIWDEKARTLFCARDRLGIKPFYYYWDGKLFAFASEIKALLEHPAIQAALDEEQLSEYLAFGYVSSENTLFSGIKKLMPGHTLTLKLKGGAPEIEIRQYWDPPVHREFEERSEAEWIRECRTRLEETVRMRLMSDVPLGLFLSGGVDSSAIAALVKRMAPGPVKTFSVGYQETPFSELAYARQVAEAIGTEHRDVTVSSGEFFHALPRLIWHEDEPISWPSSVSLYFVSRLAASEVKVVLTGEGADELFAGYERYQHYLFNARWMQAWKLAPAGLREMVRRRIGTTSLLSASARRKLGHTFLGRGEAFEALQLDNFYCAFSVAEQRALGAPFDGHSAYANYLRYWNQTEGAPVVPRMLYADQKTYLVELLMKQDQMSMACSIESRVPFLDHTFVEFSTRVPPKWKIRNGEQKYILKRSVEDLLPRDIIYRKKMGFPTPLRQWLREEGAGPVYAALQSGDGLIASYLDRDRVRGLLERHRNGVEDATDRIWRLINLQLWGDIFLSGRGERWAEGVLPGAGAAPYAL